MCGYRAGVKFVAIISLAFSMAGCNLTRNNVIGKWKGNYGDTLIMNKDNSFIYKIKPNQENLDDTSKRNLTGQWTLSKKMIDFKFADTTQNFGGGCNYFQYWWLRNSRKTLIRPMTCKSPTNRFVTITKID